MVTLLEMHKDIDIECVQALLDAEFDFLQQDKFGMTALHHAVAYVLADDGRKTSTLSQSSSTIRRS